MKLGFALTGLALTGLAGCATDFGQPPPVTPVTTTGGAPVASAGPSAAASPAPTAPIGAHRAGFGIIESISLVTLPATAAAGGTLPAVEGGPYRMTVRMDDGSIQTLIQDSRAVLVGDRVQIMPDGRLIRP